MNKNLIILSILFLLVVVGLSGCIEEDIVKGTGKIQYIDLEGGFYGIISDDSEHYDPLNLPSAFQQDDLRVEYRLRILENQSSIHMWGIVVEVLEITKL